MTPSPLKVDGPEGSPDIVVLAHGAGAPMDSPFMNHMAAGLAGRGLKVVRFEFPYMRARRAGSGRRPPDRTDTLKRAWCEVVDRLGGGDRLIVGGKSLGGRIASMIADEVAARGLVCLGYPFHPPGKPETLRVAHLEDLRTPALILQGDRDAFGRPDEIASYPLASGIRIAYVEDGDHSFRPRVRSGRTERDNLDAAVAEVAAFVAGL